MHKEKNRIEQILNHGEEILKKQPKLSRKSYQDVLDFLDDGSDEMISDRWRVTAWILVNRINSMETEKLVDELKVENFNRGLLTYEYAGYLLQVEISCGSDRTSSDGCKERKRGLRCPICSAEYLLCR